MTLLAAGGVAVWKISDTPAPMSATTGMAMPTTGPAPSKASPDPPAAPGPSGDPMVAIAPAVVGQPQVGQPQVGQPQVGQPQVGQVVIFLNSYFSAINRHDFEAYSTLFIPAIRATMTAFGTGYLSTRDSGARLIGLSATGPHGLAATVTFTSHQDPPASPDNAACDHWRITLFLKRHGNTYLIRHRRTGFPPDTFRACA